MIEIRNYSIEQWKQLIKNKATENALIYLNTNIGSKSRNYKKLKMSYFLCPNFEEIPIETAKFIAKVQSHMVENVKTNFPGKYEPNFLCQSCKLTECNQSHLLYCSALIGSNELITYIPYYEDIFNDEDPKEQCFIANVMIANLKKKKLIEDN